MDQSKQILILEDLRIPKTNFHDFIEKANLDYHLIWETTKAKPERVEVLINVKQRIDQSLIDQYPNLKMIAVAFTGYDSIDLEYCDKKGIAVYNVPAYSTRSVTELVLGLSISLSRKIPLSDQLIRSGKWDLKPGLELYGKTVGIMGTGKIGINTAKIFKALGCELIAWSRSEKEEFKKLGGKYISDKKDFFKQADLISIHLPFNENTKHIVGESELKSMKKSAFLINTARGPIIDEEALLQILKEKRIAGAGLDVFTEEPISKNNELLKLENVVLTPHIAYKTEEALERRAKVTVENILHYNQNNSENRVN